MGRERLLQAKQVMTSFDLYAIVSELANTIKGARVNNIYQTGPSTMLLSLHHPKNNLIIEAGRRIHLTAYRVERPPSPPPFCRALRKHLRRGAITNVHMHEFERIIVFEVSTREAVYKLIAEIFGRGNIILIDDGNRIIHALNYRRMRDRNIVRGEAFKYPPARGLNPLMATRRQLEALRGKRVEAVRGLSGLFSLGGLYGTEVLKRAGVDGLKPSNLLNDDDLESVYRELAHMVSRLTSGELLPHIVFDDEGNWLDVLPFPLSVYEDLRVSKYPSFNEAADEYYTKITTKAKAKAVTERFDREVQKRERILDQQRSRLRELRKIAEENQRIGNIIYAHLDQLQSLIQTILEERRSGRAWEQIKSTLIERGRKAGAPPDYLRSIDPKRGLITVEVDGKRFQLSLRKTAQQSASLSYKRAKEARGKIGGLERAMAQTVEDFENLKQRRLEVEVSVPRPLKRRKRAWYEKFHWCYSSEGFLMIGGRDATTNELLINRHMEQNDLILHADMPGAPFVLIKAGGRTPSGETISEAAQLSASYSRAWREGLRSIDVYWVRPEQVSKKAPSGEYVPRGAFMVYGTRNYVRNVPLRLSIGVKQEGEWLLVVGGPTSAVASQTDLYVEVVPGRQKGGALAKRILFKLAEGAGEELRDLVRGLPLDEVQRFIPAGKGEIALS
ncbi:MAG: ribosome rescue protein RqcH [Candidatus Bathyarchaeia archaeon]